jgi:hypothetical protein
MRFRRRRSKATIRRPRRGREAGHRRQGDDAVPAEARQRSHRGASLKANIALVKNNARLAAEIAVALAGAQ